MNRNARREIKRRQEAEQYVRDQHERRREAIRTIGMELHDIRNARTLVQRCAKHEIPERTYEEEDEDFEEKEQGCRICRRKCVVRERRVQIVRHYFPLTCSYVTFLLRRRESWLHGGAIRWLQDTSLCDNCCLILSAEANRPDFAPYLPELLPFLQMYFCVHLAALISGYAFECYVICPDCQQENS